jgi:phospholipase C
LFKQVGHRIGTLDDEEVRVRACPRHRSWSVSPPFLTGSRSRDRRAAAVSGGVAAAVTSNDTGPSAAVQYVLPKGFSGTMADLKHVVILMQENRSFDHYFAQLPGVRSINDKQALRFQDGTTVFQQRDVNGAIFTPTANNGTWGNDHSFYGADGGRWDSWVKDKSANCMQYHTAAYMPFYYSVASQYTLCD